MKDYHSHPAMSASKLKHMEIPLVFWDKFINQDADPNEQTPAMLRGSAYHCAALEPDKFDSRYCVKPEDYDGRTKAGKEFKEFLAIKGIQIVEDEVIKMAVATRKHPFMQVALTCNPVIETPIFWDGHDNNSVHYYSKRMMPDMLIHPCDKFHKGALIDLKSTNDASESGFFKTFRDQQMHIQAAWYVDGIKEAHGFEPDFYWFAQEPTRPYLNRQHKATQAVIDHGRAECERLMNSYAECVANDYWPGYIVDNEEVQIPDWYLQNEIGVISVEVIP